MGSELSWQGFLKLIEGKIILLGESHFYAPHQQYASKLADDLGIEKIGVEMVPTDYDQKSDEDKSWYLFSLDVYKYVITESNYLSLRIERVVGLRDCVEYSKIEKGDDLGYSKMLAGKIKEKGTKLNLLGNQRIFEVEKLLDNAISIPQIIVDITKPVNETQLVYIENRKIYSNILG